MDAINVETLIDIQSVVCLCICKYVKENERKRVKWFTSVLVNYYRQRMLKNSDINHPQKNHHY